jgi:putative transposase
MGYARPVADRDRDLDRADVSPASETRPIGSIDTCRVRSNHRVSCTRSLTLKLSPNPASVPSLFQWLDRRPDPDSIPGMQALVDEFDVHYNTQRRHQSLSYRDSQGRTYRLTPQQAWDATPVATPPQPPDPVDQTDPSANSPTASSPGRAGWRENLAQSVQDSRAGKTRRSPVGEHLRIPDSGHDIRVVNARGYASFRGVRFKIGPVSLWAGVSVHVAWDPDCITFAGPDGEVLAIHEHPPAGVSYIGSGRPPGRPPKDPNAPG